MHALRLLLAAVALCAIALPARAEGRWVARAAVGESISERHGSALEGALVAEVKPDLWLGLESGVCLLTMAHVTPSYGVIALDGVGHAVGGLTDGITRDRVFFLGPQVRWGSAAYLVASYGMADVSGNYGATQYLQGGSVGVGIGGTGRFEPSAELRRRFVSDAAPGRPASLAGDALTFTVGLHLR
jgi:hypothetical protein